jgi:hypothetical protein
MPYTPEYPSQYDSVLFDAQDGYGEILLSIEQSVGYSGDPNEATLDYIARKGPQATSFASLDGNPVITPDVSLCVIYICSGSNTTTVTMDNPINGQAGQEMTFLLDMALSPSAATFSWGSAYANGASGALPSSLSGGMMQILKFIYNGTTWFLMSNHGPT